MLKWEGGDSCPQFLGSSRVNVRYGAVSFDCADPARFYGRLLDLPVLYSRDDFVALGHTGQPGIAFVRIDGYQQLVPLGGVGLPVDRRRGSASNVTEAP